MMLRTTLGFFPIRVAISRAANNCKSLESWYLTILIRLKVHTVVICGLTDRSIDISARFLSLISAKMFGAFLSRNGLQ
jgi:hypothetical protein